MILAQIFNLVTIYSSLLPASKQDAIFALLLQVPIYD